MLFLKNKDGILRLCIDYWKLNKVTIKRKYLLPQIDDLLDQMKDSNIFSNIDLSSGYHQVFIKEEDINKTTFRTRYWNYEFTMLPFDLINVLTTFLCLMNNIFNQCLDTFVLEFLDDILMYSKNEAKHEENLTLVFQVLRECQLYAKLNKCDFYQSKV